MFRRLFGPRIVHYNDKYAIMRMNWTTAEYRDNNPAFNRWWIMDEYISKYCLIDSLEEAKKLLDVCVKHNKRVKE